MNRPFWARAADGQWHHVAIVARENTASPVVYLDGVRYNPIDDE